MTRPMPGPPDWYDIDWNPTWGMVRVHYSDKWDRTFSHAELDEKRLTYEGCSAHYWQAKSALGSIEAVLVSPALLKSRIRVWDRFTNTPHALEAGR